MEATTFFGLQVTRRYEERNESRIEFIGEQDGPVEQELKDNISTWLEGDRHVSEAYLAIVGLQPADPRSVALCLVSSRPHDTSLVQGVLAIFAKLFKETEFMDILFLSDAQRDDVRRVCRPFFSRST